MFIKYATNAFGASFEKLIIIFPPILSSQSSLLSRECIHMFLTLLGPNDSSRNNSPWEIFL